MQYSREFISGHEVPRAREAILQHVVDTYASETDVTWWGAEPTVTLDAVRRAQR